MTSGSIGFTQSTAPANPAGTERILYMDSATGQLTIQTDAGKISLETAVMTDSLTTFTAGVNSTGTLTTEGAVTLGASTTDNTIQVGDSAGGDTINLDGVVSINPLTTAAVNIATGGTASNTNVITIGLQGGADILRVLGGQNVTGTADFNGAVNLGTSTTDNTISIGDLNGGDTINISGATTLNSTQIQGGVLGFGSSTNQPTMTRDGISHIAVTGNMTITTETSDGTDIHNVLNLTSTSTDTITSDFGPSLSFAAENAAGNIMGIGEFGAVFSSVTTAQETSSFFWDLKDNNLSPASHSVEVMSLNSTGFLTVGSEGALGGGIIVSGKQITYVPQVSAKINATTSMIFANIDVTGSVDQDHMYVNMTSGVTQGQILTIVNVDASADDNLVFNQADTLLIIDGGDVGDPTRLVCAPSESLSLVWSGINWIQTSTTCEKGVQ